MWVVPVAGTPQFTDWTGKEFRDEIFLSFFYVIWKARFKAGLIDVMAVVVGQDQVTFGARLSSPCLSQC